MSFTSLVKFIPGYFVVVVVVVAIANGIFFLISVSDYFIVGPAVLPHSLMRSWWGLQGFLYTLSCHLQTRTVLLPPFQFLKMNKQV